jgi:hypothetical protein
MKRVAALEIIHITYTYHYISLFNGNAHAHNGHAHATERAIFSRAFHMKAYRAGQ